MLRAKINIEGDRTIDSDTKGIQPYNSNAEAFRPPAFTQMKHLKKLPERAESEPLLLPSWMENLSKKNIYGLGYRVWKFPEVYLALNAQIFSCLPLLQEFFFVLNINKGSLSITFTLYIVHKANGKLFSFSLFPFGDELFVSYSIRRVFYFFCFPSINIVNALIYSAFRRQKQKKASEGRTMDHGLK